MVLGLMTVLALWSWDNADYIATMNKQLEQGFAWKSIDCRDPDESVPYIAIESPNGKKWVCNKLVNQKHAALAQLVEQLICNQQVRGSSP